LRHKFRKFFKFTKFFYNVNFVNLKKLRDLRRKIQFLKLKTVIMSNYHLPLEPNSVYHIWTHAVHNNNLFANLGNYDFFLKKWQLKTNVLLSTYAYCLMPNHLHFCIQTADIPKDSIKPGKSNGNIFENSIKNGFISYVKAFNKQQNRQGALLRDRFGRSKVTDKTYLKDLICYLHHNPIHHFNYADYSDYSASSFNLLLHYSQLTEAERANAVISAKRYNIIVDLFGGMEAFREYHRIYKEQKKYKIFQKMMDDSFKNNPI
jgi:putative transposase